VTTSRVRCPAAEDTIAAGFALGKKLRPSDVVLVSGSLGSGKTTFVRGLVRGYGLDCPVTSPSFALIHVYGTGERQVVHVDPYRLGGAADVEGIGLSDYLDTDAVVVIEWPERLGPMGSPWRVSVTIAADDRDVRHIQIRRRGMAARSRSDL